MSQPFRLAAGGAIDRERVLRFRFNGVDLEGHPGDTLASALLANGVRLVARSFKYHRPRGIVAAGVEEPGALVQLGEGARTVPNLKATEIELFEGLAATSVNVFPSLRFDLGAAMGMLSRFTPAGFYYKTFIASPRLWHRVFEPVIRRAGGWGRAPREADPDCYDRMHVHCEVLVVGAGPAGLMAARSAAAGGARVILADEGPEPGGTVLYRDVTLAGRPGPEWVRHSVEALAAQEQVRVLRRTTVVGYHDGNFLVALERRGHEGEAGTPGRTRQRLWHIRAERVILATGAHERPVVFANNDRPGVMLAGALQAYVRRWAVLPARRTVVFTNNDRAYECALAVLAAGGTVAAVVDSRRDPDGPLVRAAKGRGVTVLDGHAVVDAHGTRRLRAVSVAPLGEGGAAAGAPRRLPCDGLAVSAGYSPVVHLHSQSGGGLRYDAALAAFLPDRVTQAQRSAGGCNGTFGLAATLAEAREAGLDAARRCGFAAPTPPPLPEAEEAEARPLAPLWCVDRRGGAAAGGRSHFVDLQNDTTAADIRLAAREGFDAVEHMKRYTLAGFGTDQGKTSNVNALAVLGETVGRSPGEVGTTTFRPPYTPVTFAVMGGRDRGELFDPARLTAMHELHVAAGAVFEDVGQWKRPRYYPQPGEDMDGAVARECSAVRAGVGMQDVSTLGKIDVQGPDAAEFLDRVYINGWRRLRVGRVRYGVMCREDGTVFDDGTTARLDEHRYLMTTTSGGAAAVLDHLEEYLQTEWPTLRVRLTSVTEQWSTVSLAGPRSRDVLAAMAPGMDLSPEGFPFLAWRDGEVAGLAARVFRISFSGELQYEINVPWHYGAALWRATQEAGQAFGITPYGTETMHVLRAEKGFIIVGQETDGTQTPLDLGLGALVSTKKDFIGRRSLRRADMVRADRQQLVGLLPKEGGRHIPEGSQLVEAGTAGDAPPVPMLGFVTSSYFSPTLGSHFCLALVAAGRDRIGDVIAVALPDGEAAVAVCDPVFHDPDNERRDG